MILHSKRVEIMKNNNQSLNQRDLLPNWIQQTKKTLEMRLKNILFIQVLIDENFVKKWWKT